MLQYNTQSKSSKVIAPLPSSARLRDPSDAVSAPSSYLQTRAVLTRCRVMSPASSSSPTLGKHRLTSPPPPYDESDIKPRKSHSHPNCLGNSRSSPIPKLLGNIPVIPKPIPHVVLPFPFQDFCLTSFLITDADDLHAIINHPVVARGLGLRSTCLLGGISRSVGPATSSSFTMADAVSRIHDALEHKSSWPYNVIRKKSTLVSDQFPPLLGTVNLFRESFASLPSRLQRKWRERERKLTDMEAHWNLEFCLDPAFAGRGLMTGVLQFLLEQWFLPVIHPQAGILSSTYLASNMAAARVHAKLGFRPVAIRRGRAYRSQHMADLSMAPTPTGDIERVKELGEIEPEEDLVCTVWQRSGTCALSESIFEGMTPWVPAMAGPPISSDFAWINTSETSHAFGSGT